jgi:phosphoribosyl-dephospho-CoA transferase
MKIRLLQGAHIGIRMYRIRTLETRTSKETIVRVSGIRMEEFRMELIKISLMSEGRIEIVQGMRRLINRCNQTLEKLILQEVIQRVFLVEQTGKLFLIHINVIALAVKEVTTIGNIDPSKWITISTTPTS